MKSYPFGINLLECFTAALRKDEVTRVAVAGFDRLVPIGSNVFAVVAAETAVPILVSNKIRIRPPIDFHLREKILAIDRLRYTDDRVRLRRDRDTLRADDLRCLAPLRLSSSKA